MSRPAPAFPFVATWLRGYVAGLALALPAAAQLPGFEIVPITADPDRDSGARINNCGEVVFSKRINQLHDLEEIFLYDNGKTTRLTTNTIRDAFPHLNDVGQIVWVEGVTNAANGNIVLATGGVREVIGFGGGPVINDTGQIAWDLFDPTGCASPSDIFLYEEGQVTWSYSDGLSNQSVAINNLGELVWTGYSFCAEPWISTILEYDGESVTPLSADQDNPQIPSINDAGDVVWSHQNDLGIDEVQLLRDGVIVTIADDARAGRVNDRGRVAFHRWDAFGVAHPWTYADGELTQVSTLEAGVQDLNDLGEIVLFVNLGFPASDLWLHRRVRAGDGDLDGDVDVADLALFVNCLPGVEPSDGLCSCRFFDIDEDRDVDLADSAEVINRYGS